MDWRAFVMLSTSVTTLPLTVWVTSPLTNSMTSGARGWVVFREFTKSVKCLLCASSLLIGKQLTKQLRGVNHSIRLDVRYDNFKGIVYHQMKLWVDLLFSIIKQSPFYDNWRGKHMCTLHDKFNLNLAIYSQKKKGNQIWQKAVWQFSIKKRKKRSLFPIPTLSSRILHSENVFFGISCTYLFDLLVLTYLTI